MRFLGVMYTVQIAGRDITRRFGEKLGGDVKDARSHLVSRVQVGYEVVNYDLSRSGFF